MTSPWRIAGSVALAAIVIMFVLAIDLSPAVGPRAAPTAEQVRDGRDALRRLRDATQAGPPNAAVAFSASDLDGIAALAANALHVRRIAVGVDGGMLAAAASVRPLPGVWLNLRTATATAAGTGFPPLSASIGDLPLPRWLTRAVLDGARASALRRGGRLPPLDVLVQRFAVTPAGVSLLVAAPLASTNLVRQIVAVQATPVDGARVAAIYCRLVAENARAPAVDLATQVARAMRPPVADPVEDNRAALVALAMLTVGDRAADLAGTAVDRAGACRIDPPGIRLGGREDLAKHWTLSAALGATVGGEITTAMGEWKELSDSLPGGSGFSFVDLAADRAGLRFGRGLVDPASAAALRAALARTVALLPLDAAMMDEGMTNADFVARYGTIDGRDYRATIRQIDRLLDREPLLRALR